ncbi:hypothetical protein V493_02205 [Pseudogymnoascus sp. VKM F-4281 (FW-2241)]|nr:hypothetical protein V493_02205 [Pseudogymnoascus sp. VKM F-4281 (FW-2241)]
MDPKKVSAVLDWPTPTTVKEVQAFLGFANFYRRFIAGYSKVAQPLTELTKKDLAFNWTDKAEAAFQELKTKFTEAPILATFDPKIQLDGQSRGCVPKTQDEVHRSTHPSHVRPQKEDHPRNGFFRFRNWSLPESTR